MNGSRFLDILASLVVVTLVIGLVLPGRQTGSVVRELGTAGSGLLRTAQGRG